jgi:hypothetical protein
MVSHVYTNSSHVSLDSGGTVNAGQGAGLGADVASVVRHGSAKSAPVSNTLSNSSVSQGGLSLPSSRPDRRITCSETTA